MSLPFDYARCLAHKPYGIPAVPCRDCQRYTETATDYFPNWFIYTPQFINGVCAYRIAPEGETK